MIKEPEAFHSLLKKFKEDVKKIPNYNTTMNKYVIPLFEMLMEECRHNTHHLIIISDLEKRVKCLENETDKGFQPVCEADRIDER